MVYNPVEVGAKCGECPFQHGHKLIPPSPPAGVHKLTVVGEGPGRLEGKLGAPFVGPSGGLLNRLMKDAGFPFNWRGVTHLTNSFLCFGEADSDSDMKAAAKCCQPRLENELKSHQDSVPILTLGSPASKAIIGNGNILKIRGFMWEVPPKKLLAGRRVFPTLHPAFLLRGADTWKPVVVTDLKRLRRFMAGEIAESESRGRFDVYSNVAALGAALRKLGPVVEVDVETNGVDPMSCGLDLVGVCDVETLRAVIAYPWRPSMAKTLSSALKRRTGVFHNGPAFDHIVLDRHRVSLGKVEDTLIAHHSFASHLRQGLDHCASVYTDSEPWKLQFRGEQVDNKGGGFGIPAEKLAEYNCADIRLGALVWKRMQPDLERERNVYEFDMAVAGLCRRMQMRGLLVDTSRKDRLSRELSKTEADLLHQMQEVASARFNPARLADLRKYFFRRCRRRIWKTTPTGAPAVDKSVLEALRHQDSAAGRMADRVLRWRTAKDVRAEYLDNLVLDENNRVHPGWKSYGTETGRPASRRPNILNTPRMGEGPTKQIRDIYIAPKGYQFVYFDLSQAEMRLAAYLSGDPNFIEACKTDVHAGNAAVLFPDAAEVLRTDPKGKGKPFRDIAKSSGFAVTYLAESEKVYTHLRANGFPVSLRDVDTMLGRMRRSYARYYAFVRENQASCEQNGYLRSPFLGRIRWLGWNPKPTTVANYPIQSSVADIMRAALLEIEKQLPTGCYVVAYIYDAAIIEAPNAAVESVRRLIADYWAKPIKVPHNGLEFTMPIDLKEGTRWSAFG